MNKFLNLEKRTALILKHRSEKNRKRADRIKAILLSDAGWSNRQISEALLLDQETISRHISEYCTFEKLSNNSGGLNRHSAPKQMFF
jgi:DNA-binding NarL/FixJ family response regulator